MSSEVRNFTAGLPSPFFQQVIVITVQQRPFWGYNYGPKIQPELLWNFSALGITSSPRQWEWKENNSGCKEGGLVMPSGMRFVIRAITVAPKLKLLDM